MHKEHFFSYGNMDEGLWNVYVDLVTKIFAHFQAHINNPYIKLSRYPDKIILNYSTTDKSFPHYEGVNVLVISTKGGMNRSLKLFHSTDFAMISTIFLLVLKSINPTKVFITIISESVDEVPRMMDIINKIIPSFTIPETEITLTESDVGRREDISLEKEVSKGHKSTSDGIRTLRKYLETVRTTTSR